MRLVSRVALTVAALVVVGNAPATAIDDSQGSPGFCADDDGTTVVVDLTKLGGEVIVRCAPGSAERTGFEALEAAGFEVEGTARFGESAACRIEGRPAADEALAIDGKSGYREPCVDMPPAAAYWSYWHGENGGDWNYSQQGMQSHGAIEGGFEGWSFALNSTSAKPSAPSVDPVRPTAQSDDSGDSGNGPTDADETDDSDSSGGQTTPRDNGSDDRNGGQQGESTGESLPKPMKRESSPPPTSGTQNGVEWSGGEEAKVADAPATEEAGSAAAPWVAGGVIAALALLIAGTTLRRRVRRGAASP